MDDAVGKAFGNTASLLFGKRLAPIEKYMEWLGLRIPQGKKVKSAFGGGETYVPDYSLFKHIPKARVVSMEDLQKAKEMKIKLDGNPSLDELVAKASKVAYFVPNFVEGNNINVRDTAVYLDCINVRDSFDIFSTKNGVSSFSTIDSENLFGCYRIGYSKFCMHCYNSLNLSVCFEIDHGKGCSRSMFCHNVENVHDSLFCFNTKNKTYAVGNVEVGKEAFTKFRDMVNAWILSGLEEKGKLNWDIYNILCHERGES